MKKVHIVGPKFPIHLSKNWRELKLETHFIYWQGHRYKLLGAYQRPLTCLELFKRFLYGMTLVVFSLTLALWCSRKVRCLFTDRIYQRFYVNLIVPALGIEPPLPKQDPSTARNPENSSTEIKNPLNAPSFRRNASLRADFQFFSKPPLISLSLLSIKEDHPLFKDLELEDADEHLLEMFLDGFGKQIVSCSDKTKKLIRDRLKQFNEIVHFEKRLPHYPPFLKIKHLLPKWEESILKYAFLSAHELISLKLKDIIPLPFLDLEDAIGNNIRYLSKKGKSISPLSKENLLDLPLIDLESLTADDLHAFTQDLHPFAFSLISLSIIPELDMKLFSREQLQALFQSEERVIKLNPKQINDCLKNLPLESLYSLSKWQCTRIDLARANQEQKSVILLQRGGRENDSRRCLDEAYAPPSKREDQWMRGLSL